MKQIIITIIIVFAAVFGWWTLSPLFINQEVDEALPIDIPAGTLTPETEQEPEEPEPMVQEPASFQIQSETPEPPATQTPETPAEVPVETETQDMPEDIIIGQDVVMDEPAMEMVSPVISPESNFQGADNFHKASGNLFVVSDETSQFLRFTSFDITNGPDLFVVLSPHERPLESSELGDYVILERLKGNKGNQNYDVTGIDLSQYKSVVVYCKAFSTVFGSAPIL